MRLLAALVIVLSLARIALTYRVFNQTVDEPVHVAAGMQWLASGEYSLDAQHPPLPRVLFALGPYLAGATVPAGADVVAQGNAVLEQHLTLARLPNLLFFLLAIVVVGLWTWQLAGPGAAIIGMAIFASLPPILGHAGLATTDMAAAATIAAALFAWRVFLDRPTWKHAALLGAAIGIGLIAKFSFVVFFPVGAVVMMRWPRIKMLLVVLPLSFLLLWSAYRFDIGTLAAARLRAFPPDSPMHIAAKYAQAPGYDWVRPDVIERYRRFGEKVPQHFVDFVDWAKAAGYPSPLAGRNGDTMAGTPPVGPGPRFEALRAAGNWIAVHVPLPAPMFFAGAQAVAEHSRAGHPAVLLGHYTDRGWWSYFPLVLFYKTPLPFLLLALVGTVLMLRRGHREALAPWAMLLPAMTSSINIGVRHILPIYPLLAIAAAFAVSELWQQHRRARVPIAALLAWLFIGTALAHPDYLAWFNETAGRHPERVALDSNLDWGQDLLRLRDAVRKERITHLYISYFGTADWRRLGIPGEDLPRGVRVRGWVAISEMQLAFGGPTNRGEDYEWLRPLPYRRIGTSIRLYFIP